MLLTDDQSNPIKNGIVRIHLLRQTRQRVSIAFYFVSVKDAVHYGNINTSCSVLHAEFFHNSEFAVTRVELF